MSDPAATAAATQQQDQDAGDAGLDGPDKPPLVIRRPASGTSRQRSASGASAASSSPGYSSDDSLSVAGSSRPPSRADAESSFTGPTAALSSRRSSTTKHSRPPSIKSDDGNGGGGHKFNLKDLLGAGVRRKGSQRSDTSSRKSDSDQSDQHDAASTASFLKKYGVCGRVAIGKGATSVVRLAHKWDRSEEKLYAVKVCHTACRIMPARAHARVPPSVGTSIPS